MFRYVFLIVQFVVFFLVSPVYASDTDQPTFTELTVKSSLSDTEFDTSGILFDYNYNELAVKAVQKQVTLFSERIRERFSIWLSRSGKYIEMMKNILKENNIPEEIVFLPLIESGFNPNAYSRAKAVGYWQFIASTARRYGLEINWWRDERRDPEKSTEAAANYLSDLYKMFGCWNLAMAAYNAGEGRILKAMNKTGTDDYWALLNTNYIKNETKDYVPKFIAASLIANSPQDFGFEDLEFYPPLEYDTVMISSPVDLDIIAKCAETSIDVIRELNPELKRWCTPPDVPEYTVRIPAGKNELFLENLESVPEEERFSIDIYKVKKGDTFTKISKKTGVPVKVILDLNAWEKVTLLKIGMKIYLPPKGKYKLEKDDKGAVKKATYKYQNTKPKPKKKI
ncbi:MAG: transglycosylase SLT domain-containing protein [Nitrospirae bacterium]|nr:transglycosylase SLT domain-containing protein [Nitrospirota bacterium]